MLYLGILALVIGAVIFFLPASKAIVKSKRCKAEVEATCVKKLAAVDWHNTSMESVVFQYRYEGKDYEQKVQIYYYITKIEEGEPYLIRINEHNPKEIYLPMPLRMMFPSERLLPTVIFLGMGIVFLMAI